MRQHIALSQLSELSEKGRSRLMSWWEPQNGDLVGRTFLPDGIGDYISKTVLLSANKDRKSTAELPLLSIGQMIEYLDNANVPELNIKQLYSDGYEVYHSKGFKDHTFGTNLCDALWMAVKELLEQ